MNLGVVVITITILGYISNSLNWRFLGNGLVRVQYYVGAVVHESSHAVVAIAMGAKILEFKAFSRQPHVVYTKPKIPILGNVLISFAPVAGGLLFLFLLNKFLFAGHFVIPVFTGWENILSDSLKLLGQINIWQWQTIVLVLVFLNTGAMIGPSFQDLKNIWPVLIILLFVKSQFLIHLGFLAVTLIIANISLQIILILVQGLLAHLFWTKQK